jgi:hypothetical protein
VLTVQRDSAIVGAIGPMEIEPFADGRAACRLPIEPEREPGPSGDVMPGLPSRPDLDQLRRQARELLRAAVAGEPAAITRIHLVSPQLTLSAAQLALAREYGFRSWSALRTEAGIRRLAALAESEPPAGGAGPGLVPTFGDRWSFGGAGAIRS